MSGDKRLNSPFSHLVDIKLTTIDLSEAPNDAYASISDVEHGLSAGKKAAKAPFRLKRFVPAKYFARYV